MTSEHSKRGLVLLVSGKRKSGKDYICEQVVKKLGKNIACIMRISEPLKDSYAEHHNLDIKKLMSSSLYKEKYRLDMINWSDTIRKTDPGFFCRLADKRTVRTAVTLVCDIRRKTDLVFFENNFAKISKRIRITADLCVRQNRGYCFTSGVDDGISECDLDDVESWDLVLHNNSVDEGEQAVKMLLDNIEAWQKKVETSDD